MRRTTALLYGIFCYSVFLASFLYLIGFVGNFIVPTTVDGEMALPLAAAVIINTALILLFGAQHSAMARPEFKRWWTQFVPDPIERSTYVLLSVWALLPIFVFWQPIPGTVWSVETPALRTAVLALHFGGWGLILLATLLIDHFDLFGMRQVWLYFRGRPYTHHEFRTPSLYKVVRHPLYVGWLLALWITPTMTGSHLMLAGGFTAYIMVALVYEERDLVTHFGDTYRRYQRTVPKLIPGVARRPAAEGAPAAAESA